MALWTDFYRPVESFFDSRPVEMAPTCSRVVISDINTADDYYWNTVATNQYFNHVITNHYGRVVHDMR